MRWNRQAGICIAVLCAVYYITPLPSLAEQDAEFLINMLLIINPVACFAANAIYASKHGFFWLLPLLSGALFIPALFIYYNGTAVVYVFSYIFLSFIAAAVGHSIYKNRDNPD